MKVKGITFALLTLLLSSPTIAVDPVPVKGCQKTARVPDGVITCLDFARANGCTISDLVAWNQGLKPDCSNLNAGLLLCVSLTPIKTTVPGGTTDVPTTATQITTQPNFPTAPPVFSTTAATAITSANSSASTSSVIPTQTKTSGAVKYSVSMALYPVLATFMVLLINFAKSLWRNVKANKRHHSNDSIKSNYSGDKSIQKDSSRNMKISLGGGETAFTSAIPSSMSTNTNA